MKREALQKILDLLVDAEAMTFDELDHAIDKDDRVSLRFLDRKIKNAAELAKLMLDELNTVAVPEVVGAERTGV